MIVRDEEVIRRLCCQRRLQSGQPTFETNDLVPRIGEGALEQPADPVVVVDHQYAGCLLGCHASPIQCQKGRSPREGRSSASSLPTGFPAAPKGRLPWPVIG